MGHLPREENVRLLKWFLGFFSAPRSKPRSGRGRVKFVEGTEMLCPVCDMAIAIARRDIHAGDVPRSSEWDIKDQKAFWDIKHCNHHLFDYEPGGRGTLVMTPTGWVG